jgi:1-acyl-sn-glycerol-3-phosphate acyltransferase
MQQPTHNNATAPTAEPLSRVARMRRAVRLAMLLSHVLIGAALVGCVYPIVSRELRLVIRVRWCRTVLWILGVDLSVVGRAPAGCHLITANHISWLDTFVIGALFPCWYVAKAETRSWPLLGWMATANDTLFLRRGSPRAVWRINSEIRHRFARGESVVVFPEGTTTDGLRVLDFYPALFQPVIDCRRPVLPIALAYHDATGRRTSSIAYIDDAPLWRSLRAVLEAPWTHATVTLDGALETTNLQRRTLARQTCLVVRRLHSERTASGAPVEQKASSPRRGPRVQSTREVRPCARSITPRSGRECTQE